MVRLWLPLLILALAACGDEVAIEPDAGPQHDAAPVAQGGPASGDLVINEVSPVPAAGADWVELLNRSDTPLDLGDFFLTDKADRLDHYQPLSGTLAPGALLVVDATAFGLSRGEEVHLVTTTGQVVDGLSYLVLDAAPDQTLARVPSGEGPFYLGDASPGEVNP